MDIIGYSDISRKMHKLPRLPGFLETFHQVRLKETEPIQSSKISAQMEYERVAPGSSEADMGVDVEILSKHGIFYQKHFVISQGSSS